VAAISESGGLLARVGVLEKVHQRVAMVLR
jgi:hypothetical protein